MPTKAPKLGVGHKKETLAQFAERYRILAQPRTIDNVMRKFTARMDKLLKDRLESLASHPKDTGLLKRSWQLPETYLLSHTGRVWQVYLNNTATVGQQASLKNAQGNVVHRKKKRVGRHNLKRYMPFVDNRTKFYTKQLRVIRNKVDKEFKEFINDVLWEANRVGLLSPSEVASWEQEFKG